MQDSTEIRTARLKLRGHVEDDAVRIADLINDNAVAQMLSRVPHPYTLADAQAFLDGTVMGQGGRDFAIDHPDFGLIGGAGFHWAGDCDVELGPEVGYWLGRTFWGRGFATEALRALLTWAAEGWGRRAIVSGHFSDNPASGQVLEKAGFLYTGEVRARHCVSRRCAVPTRMMVWLA